MKKYWKSILVVVLVLAGLGWFVLDAMKERAAMTASATATVNKVELDRDEESSSLDETDIEIVFVANGQQVVTNVSLPGDRVKDYPVGRDVAICHDPKTPSSARINTDGAACGG
ncbi:MAG TPA: DUF3592 domain-containing protein [Allosphingosinicella sp.]|nr:DUF3592 domain-containing protein [Allosphingosinicella sp.]